MEPSDSDGAAEGSGRVFMQSDDSKQARIDPRHRQKNRYRRKKTLDAKGAVAEPDRACTQQTEPRMDLEESPSWGMEDGPGPGDSAGTTPAPGAKKDTITEYGNSSCAAPQGTSLVHSFDRKVRPYIDLIDTLRYLGVDQDVGLPAVAVIGDQSSGKSSVLEALSGVQLPRGSGIVTRCPLALKLKRAPGPWHGRIKYRVQGRTINTKLDTPESVGDAVLQAQSELTGDDLGVSKSLIELEVTSDSVPDLTLIDLPGIARVALAGQAVDIETQIKDLIRDHIGRQETINLVVIPCNVDIATTEALKMAQAVDPTGVRTLGVLTKPDLMDEGTERNALRILQNQVFPLSKGYVLVKCRSQRDVEAHQTLAEASRVEAAFFKKHPVFCHVHNGGKLTTTTVLAAKLTEELVDNIKRTLPKLRKDLAEKLREACAELESQGESIPDDARAKQLFINARVMRYNDDVRGLARGEPSRNLPRNMMLYTLVREHFRTWLKDLKRAQDAWLEELDNLIREYIDNRSGRELPGFVSYHAFENLARVHVQRLEKPALNVLAVTCWSVQDVFMRLADDVFKFLPEFNRLVKAKVGAQVQGQEQKARVLIVTLFRMESMVYTQDMLYQNSLREEHQQDHEVTEVTPFIFNSNNHPKSKGKRLLDVSSLDEDLDVMNKHLRSYFKIALMRLMDMVPMVVRFNMLDELVVALGAELTALAQEGNLAELLCEDEDAMEKRRMVMERVERLHKACATIENKL
ncbi:interferon-induced GTP-binding protein Mx1-like isoform X1 [Petromyzon marinus]|uniref:interferon-induced GTP-binding protein Mx1-like isoform X1 n=1 Tax=Petromyzon marinus TaxID=7757 RepID=UPI003F6EE1B8